MTREKVYEGMSARSVVRPVVRSFAQQKALHAAAHVRAGGHAIVWETGVRARLVLREPEDDHQDLGWWSILDLGKMRYEVICRGALRGFASTLIPRDCNDIVRRRIERDRAFPGATRSWLDRLECGACCRKNHVILEKTDSRASRSGACRLARRALYAQA